MAKLAERKYAEALFMSAKESGQIDARKKEAEALLKIFSQERELMQLLLHPGVEKEEKKAVLARVFSGRIADEMLYFLQLVVEKGHLKEIDRILREFLDKVKEYKKIGVVFVQAAAELDEGQRAAIKQRILETTDYQSVELHVTVDRGLIGGIVIRIKDRICDGSVRTRLETLSGELSKIQWKAGENAS